MPVYNGDDTRCTSPPALALFFLARGDQDVTHIQICVCEHYRLVVTETRELGELLSRIPLRVPAACVSGKEVVKIGQRVERAGVGIAGVAEDYVTNSLAANVAFAPSGQYPSNGQNVALVPTAQYGHGK